MNDLFNAANKLKDYTVKINEVDLINETIISCETTYMIDSLKVTATLVIKDLYDLNNLIIWKDSDVQIEYIDVFEEQILENFKIIDIQETQNKKYEKTLTIKLQDIFSYTLEKCFLSKSFSTNVIDAFSQYINYLNIEDKELDFSSMTSETNFVVPDNMNALEWFTEEFKKYGLLSYQSKKGIHVKLVDDLILLENDENHPYLDETDNQLYKNKIYEIIPHHLNRKNVPNINRGLAFNIDGKQIIYQEYNDISNYVLNDDETNLQDDVGTKDKYQQHLDFNQLKLENRQKFLSVNETIIVVNGYIKNDLNQIYNLKLRGNRSTTDTQTKGNLIIGGKWISQKVTDKLIGDSLIQKITLNRADMTLNG